MWCWTCLASEEQPLWSMDFHSICPSLSGKKTFALCDHAFISRSHCWASRLLLMHFFPFIPPSSSSCFPRALIGSVTQELLLPQVLLLLLQSDLQVLQGPLCSCLTHNWGQGPSSSPWILCQSRVPAWHLNQGLWQEWRCFQTHHNSHGSGFDRGPETPHRLSEPPAQGYITCGDQIYSHLRWTQNYQLSIVLKAATKVDIWKTENTIIRIFAASKFLKPNVN